MTPTIGPTSARRRYLARAFGDLLGSLTGLMVAGQVPPGTPLHVLEALIAKLAERLPMR